MDSSSTAFHPLRHSDVPLYNIRAVAAATGVPAITLRSWERRYGIPVPKRDVKGYRLYSDRDIAVVRWLREQVHHGVGISRAVNMLQALERGELASAPSDTFDFESLRNRLLEAIRRLDEPATARIIGEGLAAASVEDVALNLLQPALYVIGDLWAAGVISVTTEHVGSNLIRAHLAQLLRLSPDPLRAERVVVGCAPGEMHDIGALILALFLRRRGFDVVYAGASVETESFVRDVGELDPAAVCLSASTVESVDSLRTLLGRLKAQYGGLLSFGGRVFNEENSLAGTVPGHFLGNDAAAATTRLEGLLIA